MNDKSTSLIDIGVNLSAPRLARQADLVIERAARANVRGMILTGTSPEASVICADYARDLSDPSRCLMWSTAGVHPHDSAAALERGEGWITTIEELLTRPEVIAVGECGLDFERDYSPRPAQLEVFEAQLQLAARYQRPLFLHQRGAHDPFCELLSRYAPDLPKCGDGLAAIVHCFTGDRAELDRYLKLGCHIGVTGWVCDERRGQSLQEAVPSLPLNRVHVETDAPYLTPRTLRPRPKKGINEPAFLPHIVGELARYMETEPELLTERATQNTCALFGITLDALTELNATPAEPNR